MALALPSLHCLTSFPDWKIVPISQNGQPRQRVRWGENGCPRRLASNGDVRSKPWF